MIETVKFWRCDASGCCAREPEEAEGWFNGIYTQGCPWHAAVIAAHKATVDSSTRGRGSRAVTTWYLTCACGWVPPSRWATWNYGPLVEQHRAHVEVATAEPGEKTETQEGVPDAH